MVHSGSPRTPQFLVRSFSRSTDGTVWLRFLASFTSFAVSGSAFTVLVGSWISFTFCGFLFFRSLHSFTFSFCTAILRCSLRLLAVHTCYTSRSLLVPGSRVYVRAYTPPGLVAPDFSSHWIRISFTFGISSFGLRSSLPLVLLFTFVTFVRSPSLVCVYVRSGSRHVSFCYGSPHHHVSPFTFVCVRYVSFLVRSSYVCVRLLPRLSFRSSFALIRLRFVRLLGFYVCTRSFTFASRSRLFVTLRFRSTFHYLVDLRSFTFVLVHGCVLRFVDLRLSLPRLISFTFSLTFFGYTPRSMVLVLRLRFHRVGLHVHRFAGYVRSATGSWVTVYITRFLVWDLAVWNHTRFLSHCVIQY